MPISMYRREYLTKNAFKSRTRVLDNNTIECYFIVIEIDNNNSRFTIELYLKVCTCLLSLINSLKYNFP